MATRTVFRGSRGRFAGASRGKAERVRVSRRTVSASSARPSSPRRTKAKGLGAKVKSAASNRKVQVAVGAGALGVGGAVAYNKINPGTTLRKSGLSIPGEVTTFGGKSASRPAHTIVKNSTHVYTTTSLGKGMKKTQHTTIEKLSAKGARTPIGYIDSKRAPLGGYRVTHTYLTKANRGKGLGKQGLAAHAAHRPNRTYRASMNRSNMGQAFAKSVGGAGIRSGKSKAAGKGITTQLDRAWTAGVRADRAGLAKKVTRDTKLMTPNKMVKGRRLKR